MPNHRLNDSLPQGSVNPISDHQSCSTLHFDYQLCDGKIYLRTRTPDAPKTLFRGDLVSTDGHADALEWQLFDGIGLPYNEQMESILALDEYLVEIDVASDIVIAVSNLNRIYLYKPTEKIRPISWTSLLGAPDIFKDKLYLPLYRRAWAFSCSVCTKPDVRTTDFMNTKEIVTFFSDAHGVRFDFGFTPTIYVLSGDGLKIVYWDSGLPASFSRGFLVPEGMQGQSLSAAGSTVFLSALDAEGQLHFFTRMIDYEINGACPGLKVSYADIPVVYPDGNPDNSFFLGSGIRKMPLAGWVEHPVDDITHVTHTIGIRLTGQGDNARELRIQGKDPESGWGYYSKPITATDWTFYPDPATIDVESIAYPFNPQLSTTPKLAYNGHIFYKKLLPYPHKKQDTSGIMIDLDHFHPFLSDAEPFSLIISCPDEPSESLRIHAVDAWGLHYHHHHDDELIGTVDGEPKALMGTLILTPEQIKLTENKQSRIGACLKKYFLDYHQQTKRIAIIADNGMATLIFDHITCHFTRLLSEDEKDRSFYMKMATRPELVAIPESIEECTSLLAKNQDCLKTIKSIFLKRRLHDSKYALLNINLSAIRPFAAGFFNMLQPDDPTYQQAVEDINLPLKAHRKATAWSAKRKGVAVGYQQALSLLEERISYLDGALDSLEYLIKTGA